MKISALDKDNNLKEYDVILTYYDKEYKKDYICYTNNNYDKDNNLEIFISEYNNDNGLSSNNIKDKKEYNKIKTEINKILLTIKNENDKLKEII